MKWEESDASRLRDYDKKTGSQLRLYLRSRIPFITECSVEGVAMQAMLKQGFEMALREIDDCVNSSQDSTDPSAGNYTSI